ncbi:Phospholipase/carboxylesterase/thioesterase [Coniella lustricola]|uniref:Acyl-protein thioesterase 1 n=1 Tax=Coniella lustricola TaxID=2025994 RepID=A0A2T2ZST7_9PEZI|nr:Phospholipase/carboxylesterase/thioesterase [Coniella lustricola]
MALRYKAPLVFPAVTSHTATVIFSHGLGDTGHGWAFSVENWRRKGVLNEVKFVLPHAPERPITCNAGMRMPGWFDIVTLSGGIEALRENEDEQGIKGSAEYLNTLIQQEVDAGIPSDRVVLGGFSQGAAMSIYTGLMGKFKLAGIVSLSGWLLLSKTFREVLNAGPRLNENTPIFMGQGDSDPLVQPGLSLLSYQVLNTTGLNVTHKVYPNLGHSADPQEMDDVEDFLKKRLPAKAPADEGRSEL